MLRNTVKRELTQIVDTSPMGRGCFNVEFPNDVVLEESRYFGPYSTIILCRVVFIPCDTYLFELRARQDNTEELETDEKFVVIRSPGKHLVTKEKLSVRSIADGMDSLESWLSELAHEYRYHNPLYDEFESFRNDITEAFLKHVGDSDAHFDPEESAEFERRIDELERRLEAMMSQREADQADIESMKSEMNELKVTMSYPKGIFARVASSKIVTIVKNFFGTPEGRKLVGDSAKQLFLE